MDQTRNSAEFLDIVYADYTNDEITNVQIDFISSKIRERSRILDIGCGTGRHAIPLARRGFDVVGLDSTKAMLDELATKADRARVKVDLRYEDILSYSAIDGEFGAAICFWNSFDQIAVDAQRGRIFFQTVYRSLARGGTLILEISNPSSFDPNTFSHRSTVERNGQTYETIYTLKNYDDVEKTTVGNELIVVRKQGEIVRRVSSDFVLRWWEKDEVADLARACGFERIEIYGDDYDPFDDASETMLFVMTKDAEYPVAQARIELATP
ncbi:MAG TPA: class I SAM-dependent methyltransferase [Myxococcota bacterium]|nr:class I SAM-dependent methyltransferase [Myxococcota bacterium]